MSDGHGSTPETPPGWAKNQPPPYTGQGPTPWTAPGDAPPPSGPAPSGDGRAGAPPPYGPAGQAPPRGQGYGPPPAGPHGAPGQGPYGGPGPGPYGGQPGPGPYAYGQPYGFQPPPQAPRPGIIPLRPLGLGDILDGTIKLIRSNPKATLGLSAIAAAVGTLPVAIGQAIYYKSVGGMVTDPLGGSRSTEVSLDGALAQLGGSVVGLIIQFFVVTMLTGVLTRVLGRAVFGGRITIGEAWRLTRSRLPALFGLAFLTGLIMLVPIVVAVLLIVAVVVAGAEPVAVIGVGLLLVLCVVAYGLFFTTRFALAAPAVVLERRGVIEAMRRSWRLVDGDFWRVLGIILLTQLIAAMLGGILSVPVSLVGAVLAIGGQGSLGMVVVTAVLFTVGGILSAMITYPIQAGVNGLLYTDRRMRAEAFDLVLQTAATEQQRQGWVSAAADDLWHPSHAAGPNGHGGYGAP
ncbi:DUF7544 domain-containing protein [Sphaerisporangium fuscum]|uniref:DUF7544 domain-containing protein n=1 Tax=Sphaerisporangium fuscum TaxID=2835868 RepID=UPI001BDD12E5|nr:glycerophosphoryl diester phosphodiesterase membrane domain-containing protein [Sphaerisporangium fuscum]